MTVLTSVLEKLRGKRQDQAKSVWQQYSELVMALATDQQADVDELAVVMDQLDKSEKDLAFDVERKQKRLAAARRLEQFREINATIPTLEQKHEAAQQAYVDAVQKLRPEVAAAYDELAALRIHAIQFASAESDLLKSVDDPDILDEQRDIDTRRMEIANEIREIEPEVTTARQRVDYERAQLESVKTDIGRQSECASATNEGHRKRHVNELVAKAQAAVDAAESAGQRITQHYEGLRAALRELDARQVELNKRKLIP